MNFSSRVVLGLVHHEEPERTRSQKTQAELIVKGLGQAGIEAITVESFAQNLRNPQDLPIATVRFQVFLRQLSQEFHHLREFRRRRNAPLTIPVRKRRQAVARVLSLVRDRRSALHCFERLEIEAALSTKHLKVWQKVADSDVVGAIILEDDFYLRRKSSPLELGALIDRESANYDLIDLAGGLSRESLGLPDAPGQDLSLRYLVANTTCAYFISKRACIRLTHLVESRPQLVFLAPDFLITELNAFGFSGSSLLPHDLPLIHGSREGTVESSIPY